MMLMAAAIKLELIEGESWIMITTVQQDYYHKVVMLIFGVDR